jgi:6-phosphogluconolactonase (cycloisomerase 2 family)
LNRSNSLRFIDAGLALLVGLSLAACSGGVSSTDTSASATSSNFSVGGTISGLSGSGLILQNNGGDNIAVSANGGFTFPTTLITGNSYNVSVLTQPSKPNETCVVTNGSGIVASDNITDVTLQCADKTSPTDTIGGYATGILGSGLVLQDNGGDTLAVTSNGVFTFATPLPSGMPYAVTVLSPPINPYQNCAVTGGAGTTGGDNVTNIAVSCKTNPNPAYTIGGSVSGVPAAAPVVLQDNGRDNITVSDGAFQFPLSIPSGSAYSVTLAPGSVPETRTCTFTNASGTVGSSNVTNVSIACKANIAVPVTVSGLAGTGLVLQDNGGDNLTVTKNGTATFATALVSGTAYNVTVLAQPRNPLQNCTVAHGEGTAELPSVSGISVSCTTIGYPVGGTVTGLNGSGLTLLDNGGDSLAITKNGPFTFPTLIPPGGAYHVTVLAQPMGLSQTCTVSGGVGTIVAANVSSVAVVCTTNSYTVGGTVTGLNGSGLILLDNGGDSLAITKNGPFTFSTPILSGGAYRVTVLAQPTGLSQTCTVSGGVGTIVAANISSVAVVCTTNGYTVGGTVTGLNGSGLTLLDNGGNGLAITKNGPFTFSTPILSGGAYHVTVLGQPMGLSQTCTVSGGVGPIVAANISSVAVACTTNAYSVSVTVTGLPTPPPATGLTLLNNGGGNLPAITQNATYKFPVTVLSGSTYDVTIGAYPPGYACAVAKGTGPITNSPISSVTVACGEIGGYLYVTNRGGNSISGFAIDASDGGLLPLTGIVAPPGQPNAVVVTTSLGLATPNSIVSGCFLTYTGSYYPIGVYVANQFEGVGAFSLNTTLSLPGGGSLTYDNVVIDGGTNVEYVDLDDAVDVCAVFSLNKNSPSLIYQYTVNAANGRLVTNGAPQTALANSVPVAAANVSVTNNAVTANFEYVANQGTDNVSEYSVGATGLLQLIKPASIAAGTNPSAIAATPGLVSVPNAAGALISEQVPFVYAANQGSDDIYVYQGNPGGVLSALGDPVPAGHGPTSIVAVEGLLYVANGADNTVSGYVISPSTTLGTAGTLTALTSSYPSGTAPVAVRAACITAGCYLYVVNSGSNSISVYGIDTLTTSPTYGALTLVGTFAVGVSPSAVTIPLAEDDSIG